MGNGVGLRLDFLKILLSDLTISLQYTRGVTAGKKSVRIPADLGWSIHTYLCG